VWLQYALCGRYLGPTLTEFTNLTIPCTHVGNANRYRYVILQTGYSVSTALCLLEVQVIVNGEHDYMIFNYCLWLVGVVVGPSDPRSRGRGFDSGRGIIRATTLGKLFAPNVPLFTKQYNLVHCEGLHAKAPYCGSGIGSNEQGEYCRAVLKRFCRIAKNRF